MQFRKKNPGIVLFFSDEVQQYATQYPETQKALYKAYQRLYGDAATAQDIFVKSNLRLVVSIAKHYTYKDVEFDDLIQFGNLGLIKSLEKFESTRGFKFSTYASWWIRQAIVRGIQDTVRSIRVPIYVLEKINKLTRLEKEYPQILEREPSASEFRAYAAQQLGIPPERVDKLLLQKKMLTIISLDAPISSESETLIKDLYAVPAHAESSLVHAKPQASDLFYDDAQMRDEVDAVIAVHLTPREERVIRMRYGIGEPREHSLEEIGETFFLTRERIRQIEVKALRKLRKEGVIKRLDAYSAAKKINSDG